MNNYSDGRTESAPMSVCFGAPSTITTYSPRGCFLLISARTDCTGPRTISSLIHGQRQYSDCQNEREYRQVFSRYDERIRKKMIVRDSDLSASNFVLRPFFCGRNPSKTNRSVGKPLEMSAEINAVGPGMGIIGIPFSNAC